ncbi:nicotinate-nucleotide--dimethylbenzimidazole phosphoribosyltransferase [Corynebacterium sp.]|uniref:nicotinate-nucleotide--dimethylbenzimidazole phosphoribosyltransferase n=1 Tax=Corynebacterium sp. TaxID=1720 RepID=UPI0026DCBD00|nr:nicotinate-nucleotide--dimethylbenzimidazole phosphoribosyltransferase [Corynebacterium sp.]MDO5031356.1 nicotinate-nucleotide--dimethylbenzimidazole phosphoribosyltransferase [Corynebacterium sp.]
MPEITAVPQPDFQARSAIATALATSVRGASFGRLNSVAAWLGACQGTAPAGRIDRARLVIFAGRHGIASREVEGVGLSAFAPESDEEQIAELHSGAGPLHTAARRAGVGIELVQCPPSAPIDVEEAMSTELFEEAFAVGQAAADREIDAGADLLIPTELGVGGSTVAATIIGRLSFTEPVAIVGPGSGVTDEMWKTKVTVIRDAMFRTRNLEGLEVVQSAGSPSVAALVGFIYQAALRRTPMLVDGPLTATAAVIAERIAPGVKGWLLATSVTTEPAHVLALKELELEPLLSLDMRAGQSLGALMAMPLIETAVELAGEEFAVQTRAGQSPEGDEASASPKA